MIEQLITPDKKAIRFYAYKYMGAQWVYDDHILTVFHDGTFTRGYPLVREEDVEKAGYGEDKLRYIIEHDIVHMYWNWAISGGDKPSASLWNQAHNINAYKGQWTDETKEDEEVTYAIQAAMHGKQWARERITKKFFHDGIVDDAKEWIGRIA